MSVSSLSYDDLDRSMRHVFAKLWASGFPHLYDYKRLQIRWTREAHWSGVSKDDVYIIYEYEWKDILNCMVSTYV